MDLLQMDLLFFEDIDVGETPLSGAYEVSKEEIIEFATQFDPQPFHLDEEAAKKTLLGGLSASGWHTASISMRLLYDSFLAHVHSMGGPGIDELKWVKPVRPGDRLSLRHKFLDKKESQSRPDLGIIHCQNDLFNQHGELVMTYRAPLMMLRRGAAQRIAETHATRKAVQPAEPDTPEAATVPFAGLYFDDLVIGQRTNIGSFQFTKEAIFAFAKKYDPQPFHVDEAAAKKSHFGGLLASGWHTAAAYMGQLIRHRKKLHEELIAKGVKPAELGPSPGFNNLRWRKPVYAGETLRFTSEVVSKRPVSRPGWGLVFFHNKGFNQHNQLAYEFQAIAFWQMRP